MVVRRRRFQRCNNDDKSLLLLSACYTIWRSVCSIKATVFTTFIPHASWEDSVIKAGMKALCKNSRADPWLWWGGELRWCCVVNVNYGRKLIKLWAMECSRVRLTSRKRVYWESLIRFPYIIAVWFNKFNLDWYFLPP